MFFRPQEEIMCCVNHNINSVWCVTDVFIGLKSLIQDLMILSQVRAFTADRNVIQPIRSEKCLVIRVKQVKGLLIF